MYDPMQNINQMMAESQRRMNASLKQVSKVKAQEIERQERNNELLEINVSQNAEMIKLQKTEVNFLENIDGNTAALVQLLGDLELTNQEIGQITNENMLEIQRLLEEIVSNSDSLNISETLLKEVKKQIIEKGVGFGIQLFISGVKCLFKANEVS